MHPDENILGIVHGAGGNGKRVHGDAELVDIGVEDGHMRHKIQGLRYWNIGKNRQ